MNLVSLAFLAACHPADPTDTNTVDVEADADTDADSDSDADTDADTDVTSVTGPTAISLTCLPTDNALRSDCTVTVDPPQAVQVSWSRDDGLGPTRTRVSDQVLGEHPLPLYYFSPQQAYTLVATATGFPEGLSSTLSLTAGTPPVEVGTYLTVTGASSLGLVGTEDPCDQGAYAVIYDTVTGDLVWYQDLDPQGSLGMLDMVRFTDQQTVIGETDGKVVEVDLTGADLTRFPVDYPGCCGLNHDIFATPGFYWSQYQHIVGGLTLDNVVVLDSVGIEQYQWDPADHLPIPGNAFGDYLHTNSEYVDANGDFYLSWLNRDAVGKFVGDRTDPAWGERIWVMTGSGADGDLGNDITLDWSAIAGPHTFGGQHNFHGRHDGRLMVLDNDHGRGLVFTIDDATLTGTVDAEYAAHESSCGAQGTAMDTVAGNALVGCDTDWIREYDQATAALIWEAQIECRNGGGGGFTSNAATRWYPLDGWE